MKEFGDGQNINMIVKHKTKFENMPKLKISHLGKPSVYI